MNGRRAALLLVAGGAGVLDAARREAAALRGEGFRIGPVVLHGDAVRLATDPDAARIVAALGEPALACGTALRRRGLEAVAPLRAGSLGEFFAVLDGCDRVRVFD